MNRTAKAVTVGVGFLSLLWWRNSKQPLIRVLSVVNVPLPGVVNIQYQPVGIVFEMKVNGKRITDTFYENDTEQIIEAGDGEHYFISKPEVYCDTGGTNCLNGSGVRFWIAVKHNDDYGPVAGGWVSFNYRGPFPLTLAP